MSSRDVAVVLSLVMVMSVFVPVAAAGASPAASATDTASTAPTAAQTDQVPEEPPSSAAEVTAEEAPPDPEEDRLGWENGYWYNESIDVDRSDGLNDSELEKVVARSMARVEEVRELEFEADVPVEVISREEYQSDTGDYETPTEDRLHQNAKWESTFMIGEDENAIEVQQANRGATVQGFYSPTEDRIVIISENTSSPKLDEITLSQELFHALQDQKWDLTNYYGRTTEANNAYNGIIEGDGNYVDYLYEQRCNGEWDCLLPPENGGGGGGADIHFGVYFVSFQPYSDGPGFVQGIHQEEGWEGVNDVYENPPASSEQVIHPEKYPDEEPSEVTVEHNPQNGWEVLEMGPNRINYAEFGEAGIASMLYYQTFAASQEAGAATEVTVPYNSFFNTDASGDIQDVDPYNYAFEASSGWDGDRLYPYVNEESSETGETGYVWKLQWDTEADAEEFVSSYETIIEHHGGERADGLANTWRIPDDEEFGDAFHIEQDGTTVIIVNAPTQDALQDIRPSVEFEEGQQTTTTEQPATDEPVETTEPATDEPMETTEPMDSTEMGTTAPDDGDDDGGAPGLGAFAALTALAATLVLWTRRTDRN